MVSRKTHVCQAKGKAPSAAPLQRAPSVATKESRSSLAKGLKSEASLSELAAFLGSVRNRTVKIGRLRRLLISSLYKLQNLEPKDQLGATIPESDKAAKKQLLEHIHFLLPSAFASCSGELRVHQVGTAIGIHACVCYTLWR